MKLALLNTYTGKPICRGCVQFLYSSMHMVTNLLPKLNDLLLKKLLLLLISCPVVKHYNSPRLPACSNSTLSAYIFLSILQLACLEPTLAIASSLDARDWTCFIL